MSEVSGMFRELARVRSAIAASAAVALLSAGCQDELAAPTKGFIEVDTGGLDGVEVFLDGESVGFDVRTIGPIPEGVYLVAVAREGFLSDPSGAVEVSVRPAETARARFRLTPVEFGAVAVSAADELTGGAVAGAEILRREGGGFVPTGLVTPAVLAGIPLGPLEVLVRRPEYADASVVVTVARGDTADAAVELGPPRKVLAEMFTYVGCSACPESADSLQSLQATRPGRVFVIEWHTRQRLPLYDARWAERGAAYGADQYPYPAVVLQGGYADTPPLLIGSQDAELFQYRIRGDAYLGECESDCDYALAAEGAPSGGAFDLTARVKWRAGPPRGALALRFVLVERKVRLGNAFFDDVPRNYAEQAVSFAAPGEVQELGASLSVDPLWGELDYVVYLQSDASLEILAIDGTY
jgi:hypothetical protein